MTTSNMSLNEPSVGVTAGPTWATETNANWELLDAHDHTSGKGVQLTPSALNINADMEFNQNSATELKNAVLDNDIHASSSGDTNYSVYSYGANLYWRNGSGTAVQITNGASLNSTGGAITSPTTNSQVLFSSSGNSYTFKYDKTQTDGIAKMIHSDLQLYFYNSGSATTRSVNLKYLGSGTGSNTLTVPDETGTLLSTATSFAGAINIATSSTNYPINLKPNGTGHVVIGNTGATGKLTSNGAYDLVLDTNSGTNSGTITIQDGVNGEITFDTNGTGDINLTAGADINIPQDIGLTFGNDGEKIEGNGTKLDIAAAELDFSIEAGGDINIGTDIGLTFGADGEKIEGDGTDLTIASSGEINVNSGTLDLSAQTVDVTLNGAVDALNFDSNTLSIDASNSRVGIGETAPDCELHIKGDTPRIKLEATTATSTNDAGVIFANQSDVTRYELWHSENDGTFYFDQRVESDGWKFKFRTYPSGGSINTDALVIAGDGSVGIGATANIGSKLTIKGDDAISGGIAFQASGTTSNYLGMYLDSNNDFRIQRWPGTGAMEDTITIDTSSGNVGIGTSAPGNILTVKGAGEGDGVDLTDADVAHGITNYLPTDAFIRIGQQSATEGGGRMIGVTDNAGQHALSLYGFSTSSPADTVNNIQLIGANANSTGIADVGGDKQVLQVKNNATALMTVLGDGKVGINTTDPGQVLDCNDGSGNMIADGYDTHSLAIYKENIEDASGYLDKVLACPAQKWNRKPFVSADEIKKAVLGEFGETVWKEYFPEDNSHRQKALYNMPDGDLKTWIDDWCEVKRVEMRPENKWQKKRLGLVADAELTAEHLPEVVSINDDGEPTGIDTMTYIGILHNAIQELSAKVEALENA